MAYTPARGWLEPANGNKPARAHIDPNCDRIAPGAQLAGPYLFGQLTANWRRVSVCRCAKRSGTYAVNEGRHWNEVSGGLPTLGRRN